jgi:ribosomal protein L32
MSTTSDRSATTASNPRRQAMRAEGRRRIIAALHHLLDVFRNSPRCAPWRSGRTLADLARRSGLSAEPDARRQPIAHALLESLERAGLVERRAGHYRLARRPAERCPACGSARIVSAPPPEATSGELATLPHHRCADCSTWAGVEAPAGSPVGVTRDSDIE